jgi:guanylate kinase
MPALGKLYVIAAPSGTGKTSLVKALVESLPTIKISISHTTRPKRPAEVDGLNYYFIEETAFKRMIERKAFLEYATVFNHFYGTSRHFVEETLGKGFDVILEIDWQGCQQIKHLFPNCTSIFILPPSQRALAERLCARNQDKPEIIKQRLVDVSETISHLHEFDYVVINDDFDTALHELSIIIHAGQLEQPRQTEKHAKLLAELALPFHPKIL